LDRLKNGTATVQSIIHFHKMKLTAVGLLALLAVAGVVVAQPIPTPDAPAFKYVSPPLPTGDDVIFVETFDDEGCLKRWISSTKTAFKGLFFIFLAI
jgi:hypothetical protein